MNRFSSYKNRKDIGRLAIVLAKYTYFASRTMAESTITGHGGTKPLDARKMEQLRANIRGIFPLLNDEFLELWKDCKSAIASACKALRSNAK